VEAYTWLTDRGFGRPTQTQGGKQTGEDDDLPPPEAFRRHVGTGPRGGGRLTGKDR
jgi:hypothetical protein